MITATWIDSKASQALAGDSVVLGYAVDGVKLVDCVQLSWPIKTFGTVQIIMLYNNQLGTCIALHFTAIPNLLKSKGSFKGESDCVRKRLTENWADWGV